MSARARKAARAGGVRVALLVTLPFSPHTPESLRQVGSIRSTKDYHALARHCAKEAGLDSILLLLTRLQEEDLSVTSLFTCAWHVLNLLFKIKTRSNQSLQNR